MKGGKKMIPCIMAIIVGLFFLWVPTLLGKTERKVEQYGISTVAQVMGFRTIEGGDVSIAVRFTDEYGVEHTGSSQQFTGNYEKYRIGDPIRIKYVQEKKLGMDTITIRVIDDQLKESGAKVAKVFKFLGMAFLALGIVFLFF